MVWCNAWWQWALAGSYAMYIHSFHHISCSVVTHVLYCIYTLLVTLQLRSGLCDVRRYSSVLFRDTDSWLALLVCVLYQTVCPQTVPCVLQFALLCPIGVPFKITDVCLSVCLSVCPLAYGRNSQSVLMTLRSFTLLSATVCQRASLLRFQPHHSTMQYTGGKLRQNNREWPQTNSIYFSGSKRGCKVSSESSENCDRTGEVTDRQTDRRLWFYNLCHAVLYSNGANARDKLLVTVEWLNLPLAKTVSLRFMNRLRSVYVNQSASEVDSTWPTLFHLTNIVH